MKGMQYIYDTFFYKSTVWPKGIHLLVYYLVLEILFVKNKINIKKFFISCFLCVAFVSFDVIIQYLFGYNLLGYKIIPAGITSVFADEAIAGSFIQKLSLLGIFGALFFFNNKNKKIIFFITILFLIGTLLASNRISVFLFIFSLIILFILNKKIRLTLLLSFITFICISQFLFKKVTGRNTQMFSPEVFFWKYFLKSFQKCFERDLWYYSLPRASYGNSSSSLKLFFR